ncbi:cation-translocating P-type ATPase [Methanolobus halotolerans]|uniref:Cation transporter n=1 Tax=Methanolobus halotolerans TaxID=2052935 RepID=A0A4E0PYY3_9EURY|nr:HAD-IC family P-type ATPase [Methanolobus halotolerans]TGC11518.1 cation transporter [Methanolobus halotolerans]
MGEEQWCSIHSDDVFNLLNSHPDGLSPEEAEIRLARDGYNEVSSKQEHGFFYRFFKQFASPLIYLLLAAAAITFILELYVDAIVILLVVLANAIIGFIQEGKAQHALESLSKLLVPEARVLRSGMSKVLPSRELVVGDVVLLEAGDRVPADVRIFYAKNLRADESILTGESVPVEKSTDSITTGCVSFGDQKNVSFAGTLVNQGQGRGIVVATGNRTQIGRISEFIRESKEMSTPLLRKMDHMSYVLSAVIVAIAALTFAVGLFRGYGAVEIFMASVSLAVAAIPEGLPAVITISMAIGVNRMAAKNTIIRTVPAVETLGSATVICTDKTGTLTKNQMTVTRIYAASRWYELTGTGYVPEGDFLQDGVSIDPMADKALMNTLKAGVLCNDASFKGVDDIDGDPTEGALLISGLKAGKFYLPRKDIVPFEPEERFMATLHENEDGSKSIYVKGSPEKVLDMCISQFDGQRAGPVDAEGILGASEQMASDTLRVLGMAYKDVPADVESIEAEDIKELVFLGLQGMMDPPREGVTEAIEKCKTAGIRVIMITGDHLRTAYSIATKVGIETEGALSGKDVGNMSDEHLGQRLDSVSVFARTSPEDKLRLVRLLKDMGEVVAVTGDGINDAPALKTADIGISMGITGTEVAKEASDMVLADDNFSSIVSAIEEGRDVYGKIQKILLWTLPTNGGQALSIVAAVLLGLTLPLVPLQILWLNTVTAIGLGVPITMEPKERGILKRPPRPPREPVLTQLIRRRVVFVSLLIVAGAYLTFFLKMERGGDIDAARTVALNTIVFFQIFYLFNSKSLHDYVLRDILSNKAMLLGIAIVLILQLVITYEPAINYIFSTAPILAVDWLIIMLVSSTVFFLIEFEKYLYKNGYLSQD